MAEGPNKTKNAFGRRPWQRKTEDPEQRGLGAKGKKGRELKTN